MEVLLERPVQGALSHYTHLFHDAFVEERETLSHVADDDLQFGKSVEYARRDHSKALSNYFLVPSVRRDTEDLVLVLRLVFRPHIAVVDPKDFVGRQAWMDVYRHIEGFGTRQHGLKIGMVEKFFADDSIGQAS